MTILVKDEGSKGAAISVFRLLGRDENALSKSLSFLLVKDYDFFREFLRKLSISHLRNIEDKHEKTKIEIQKASRREGITDIEILLNNQFHIIVEAKVGKNRPRYDQLKKYLARFKLGERNCLATLTRTDESRSEEITKLKKRPETLSRKIEIKNLQWTDVFVCVKNRLKKALLTEQSVFMNEFRNFLGGEYEMGYYDQEAMVVNVREGGDKWSPGVNTVDYFLKKHVYWAGLNRDHEVLYLACKEKNKGVTHFARVKSKRIKVLSEFLPGLRSHEFAKNKHVIYIISEPIRLPKLIKPHKSFTQGIRFTTIEKLMRAQHCGELRIKK